MDARLIGWARAVKRRTRAPYPVLWLFTDRRGPDPLAFARAAPCRPRFLCGIVLRDDAARRPARPAETELAPTHLTHSHLAHSQRAQTLARVCRARGLALTVAGDWRLARAVGAGLHLRDGRPPQHAPRGWKLLTSSAHDAASLRRARASGALVFLSPAFPTASHPGAPALGPLRWGRLAGDGMAAGLGCAALGGITGRNIRRLPRAAAAGAIGALATLA